MPSSQEWINWAAEVMPEVQNVMEDVSGGIGSDLVDMKLRQERYAAYLGRVGELHAQAKVGCLSAVAVASEKRKEDGYGANLISKLVEGDCSKESLAYESIKNLHKTLDTLLITIASRLRHESGFVMHTNDLPATPSSRPLRMIHGQN